VQKYGERSNSDGPRERQDTHELLFSWYRPIFHLPKPSRGQEKLILSSTLCRGFSSQHYLNGSKSIFRFIVFAEPRVSLARSRSFCNSRDGGKEAFGPAEAEAEFFCFSQQSVLATFMAQVKVPPVLRVFMPYWKTKFRLQ
jgi:hypothetical protein